MASPVYYTLAADQSAAKFRNESQDISRSRWNRVKMSAKSSPSRYKEGLKNSVRYIMSLDGDKRRRQSHVFSFLVVSLCLLVLIFWLLQNRTQTILQRIEIIRNENQRLLPRLKKLSIHSLMERGAMAHAKSQVGLRFVDSQAYYDAEAMRAFIVDILGSHQLLTEPELDEIVEWIKKEVPEMVPHKQVNQVTPCWTGDDNNLLCLPKAYVLGFKRSAWSDLFYRLASHPEITQSWRVEEKFLARESTMDLRQLAINYGINVQVANYFRPGLLLEGNPDEFFHAMDPSLSELNMPRSLIVAQLIRRLTPEAKLIVILRNPADAVLSYYVRRRSHKPDNKSNFHAFVDMLVKDVHNTTYNKGLDACYGLNHLHSNLLYWTYIVYLHDYLTIFPEENVYFIRTEDYAQKAKREEILQEVFDFLGVSSLDIDSLQYLTGMEPVDDEAKRWHNPKLNEMNPNTSHLLNSFFLPFNELLAETLDDHKFLWSEDAVVEHVENDHLVRESLLKIP